jgi:hypothetical protein
MLILDVQAAHDAARTLLSTVLQARIPAFFFESNATDRQWKATLHAWGDVDALAMERSQCAAHRTGEGVFSILGFAQPQSELNVSTWDCILRQVALMPDEAEIVLLADLFAIPADHFEPRLLELWPVLRVHTGEWDVLQLGPNSLERWQSSDKCLSQLCTPVPWSTGVVAVDRWEPSSTVLFNVANWRRRSRSAEVFATLHPPPVVLSVINFLTLARPHGKEMQIAAAE